MRQHQDMVSGNGPVFWQTEARIVSGKLAPCRLPDMDSVDDGFTTSTVEFPVQLNWKQGYPQRVHESVVDVTRAWDAEFLKTDLDPGKS